MIKQEKKIDCKDLALNIGSRLARSLRPAAAAILLVSSLLTTNTFAHNIDLNQARQKVDVYAKRVQKQRDFIRYNLFCQNMNRGHNHQVQCWVRYHTAKSLAAGRYACVEEITVYFQAHRGDKRNWEYYMTHVSGKYETSVPNPCGDEVLSGPMP